VRRNDAGEMNDDEATEEVVLVDVDDDEAAAVVVLAVGSMSGALAGSEIEPGSDRAHSFRR